MGKSCWWNALYFFLYVAAKRIRLSLIQWSSLYTNGQRFSGITIGLWFLCTVILWNIPLSPTWSFFLCLRNALISGDWCFLCSFVSWFICVLLLQLNRFLYSFVMCFCPNNLIPSYIKLSIYLHLFLDQCYHLAKALFVFQHMFLGFSHQV